MGNVTIGACHMDNKTIFYSSIDMVEEQIKQEQKYWDLKCELDELDIKYIDHGNFCPMDSIPGMEEAKRKFQK